MKNLPKTSLYVYGIVPFFKESTPVCDIILHLRVEPIPSSLNLVGARWAGCPQLDAHHYWPTYN